jgi:hypothetical protein
MEADNATVVAVPKDLKPAATDDKQAIFMLELTKFGENEAEIRYFSPKILAEHKKRSFPNFSDR